MYRNRNGKRIKMKKVEIEAFEISRKPSLKQLKKQKIRTRKIYREKMFKEWFYKLDKIPQKIKNKLVDYDREIIEIENATEKTIINYE